MRIGPEILADAGRATTIEWLLGNGIGGSSSGTAAGVLARDAQALLVAGAPGRPIVLLLRLEERAAGEAGPLALGVAPPAARASRRR